MIPEHATAEDCRAVIRAARARLKELADADPNIYAVKRTYTGPDERVRRVAYATQHLGRHCWLAGDLSYSGGPFAEPVDGFGSLFTSTTRTWAQTILDHLRNNEWHQIAPHCTYEIVLIPKQQPPS